MSSNEPSSVQETSTLKLLIEDDAGSKASYPLLHQELSIGRDEHNEICLTQRDISREHAQMTLQSDRSSLLVRDLESYTGIKLNGKRILGQCTFRQGDFIEIGGYVLSLEGPESSDKAQEPTPSIEPLPPEAHAKLIAVSSNLAGQAFALNQRELIIGREPSENDMVIHHRSVSRSHAKIVWRDGVFSVIDLRSANGIFVNGSAFRAAKLVSGDIITLGHVKLRYVAPGDPYVFNPADVENVEVEQSSQLKPIIIMLVAALVAWFASRHFSAKNKQPSVSPSEIEAPDGSGAEPTGQERGAAKGQGGGAESPAQVGTPTSSGAEPSAGADGAAQSAGAEAAEEPTAEPEGGAQEEQTGDEDDAAEGED